MISLHIIRDQDLKLPHALHMGQLLMTGVAGDWSSRVVK